MTIEATPVSIKVSKLDRRHTGNMWYTHRVSIEGGFWNRVNAFCEARDWLIDHYGKSREISFIGHLKNQPKPVWSWQTEYNYLRLYLTAEAMTQFAFVLDRFKEVDDGR